MIHCTGRNELNKLTVLPMCGFIAQLVEHRTGIAEVMGSNPVEALIFFRLLLSNCFNWKIYCDDHTSLLISVLLAISFWSCLACLVPSRSRSIILRIFELIIKESGSAFPRIMGRDWGRGSFIPPSAELGKACGGGRCLAGFLVN